MKMKSVILNGFLLSGMSLTGQTAAPLAPPAVLPCATQPAPVPKKCGSGFGGMICRKLEAEKQKLWVVAQQKENEAGRKLGKETKGTLDGLALPSVQDAAGVAPKPTPKPCAAASPKPLTTAPTAPAAAPATAEPF